MMHFNTCPYGSEVFVIPSFSMPHPKAKTLPSIDKLMLVPESSADASPSISYTSFVANS